MNLNSLIPELSISNLSKSLEFYIDLLGFSILYQREEEGFAMLTYQSSKDEFSQLMLDEIGKTRDWSTALLERPFGRGINLQISSEEVKSLYEKILNADIKPFLEIEEKSYTVNNKPSLCTQFIISDPDGYLIRFQQNS